MDKDRDKLDLKSYHLPTEYISSIDKCIAELVDFSKSIFLTGSWAQKTGNSSSDIDILVIIENPTKVSQALGVIKKYRRLKRNRRFLDIRVTTEDTLKRFTNPKIQFYFWNQLSVGVLLYGINQKYKIGIKASTINVLIGNLQETLNHICANLEGNLMFTGSAVMLYDLIKTIYYINHNYFYNNIRESKKQFISGILQGSYSTTRKSYYDSLMKSSDELNVKIPLKTDSRYDASDYSQLLECTTEVSALLEECKKKVLKMDI